MGTFLATGANRGIGLEYGRQPSPQLEALGVRIEAGIELSSEAAIAELVRRLEGGPLDGVILNAGILQSMGPVSSR